MEHSLRAVLDTGLAHVQQAPLSLGRLELIVRRPQINEREVITEGMLSLTEGLVGDNWSSRRRRGHDPNPDMQLNVMNARAIALCAGVSERWALAGDQLYVDLDLSFDNLPTGTRLQIGAAAIIEVTSEPHLGCKKFAARFGDEAVKWVNSKEGRALRLRGLNARVIVPGTICTGDAVRKLIGSAEAPSQR
jgi:MOSC domain-containing protein YiiM